jgi:hypothetical protein
MVRGLTYTVLAASVLPTTGIVSPLPTKAQLLMRTPELRSSVMMQYGQGYGQGYGAQQYGAQQSYGQQSYGQQSYGATKTLWTLSAFYGVGGNSKFTGAANVAQKYRILPYALGPGDKQCENRLRTLTHGPSEPLTHLSERYMLSLFWQRVESLEYALPDSGSVAGSVHCGGPSRRHLRPALKRQKPNGSAFARRPVGWFAERPVADAEQRRPNQLGLHEP